MISATAVPRERVDWLALVMARLQLLRREYKTSPEGTATLSWATIKFTWDPDAQNFYGKIIDNRANTGNVRGDVIPIVDPTAGINDAAWAIDRAVLRFLGHAYGP
jgi:hypothetical protein